MGPLLRSTTEASSCPWPLRAGSWRLASPRLPAGPALRRPNQGPPLQPARSRRQAGSSRAARAGAGFGWFRAPQSSKRELLSRGRGVAGPRGFSGVKSASLICSLAPEMGEPWGIPAGPVGGATSGVVARLVERGMASGVAVGRLPRRGSGVASRSRRREPKSAPGLVADRAAPLKRLGSGSWLGLAQSAWAGLRLAARSGLAVRLGRRAL